MKKRRTSQNPPKTVGELRRRLVRLDSPWEVDSRLGDDEPLPQYPRGGQSEEEIPEEDRLTPIDPGVDVQTLIAALTPANPYLRTRWIELGMLDQDEGEAVALDFGEAEWGVA